MKSLIIILLTFVLLVSTPTLVDAYPGFAGHCRSGDLSNKYSGHGDFGSGSLSKGSLQVQFDDIVLQPSSVNALNLNQQYKVTLGFSSSDPNLYFRGLLVRLSGNNNENVKGTLSVGSDTNVQEMPFLCADGISAMTHTSPSNKHSVTFNFEYDRSEAIELRLDVTVVIRRAADEWYYNSFDLNVQDASTSAPTLSPTKTPTPSPTKAPTSKPTRSPTSSPTKTRTKAPSATPTSSPTASPTEFPTTSPTITPSISPTESPSSEPSSSPSKSPTKSPTASPTLSPTALPVASSPMPSTNDPTTSPTGDPTLAPTASPVASSPVPSTNDPTTSPTGDPTLAPTASPVASSPVPSTNDPTVSPVVTESSSSPSSSFTSPCNDSIVRFRTRKPDGSVIWRDCIWVAAQSTNWRCSWENVSSICPASCGVCDTCVDSTARFRVTLNERRIARDCIWVGNRATVQRCGLSGVAGSCRETCGLCSTEASGENYII